MLITDESAAKNMNQPAEPNADKTRFVSRAAAGKSTLDWFADSIACCSQYAAILKTRPYDFVVKM